MFFSLYYMTSMLWQWLRQRPMMTSITGHLVDTVKGTRKDASISFYRLDDQESDELIGKLVIFKGVLLFFGVSKTLTYNF